jgi:hypothetical protein
VSPDAFQIDEDYDRANADDEVSRYGAYVRERMREFTECWDGAWDEDVTRRVVFAATAWRVATAPIMAPGYVRYHPRITSALVHSSHWDGSLIAIIGLITPWPQPLAASSSWQGDPLWRDWPTESWPDQRYLEPSEEDVAAAPYLLTCAELHVTVPTMSLPAAPAGPREWVEEAARQAVAAVAQALNEIVGPVLAQLEQT